MLLRDALGETLRDARTRQNRTLRDVSTAANVSLGYLSEVERGRKEASSELLASICDALDLQLSDVLEDVSAAIRIDTPVGKARVTANSEKQHSRPAVVMDKIYGDKATTGSRHLPAARPVVTGTRDRRQLRIVVPFERPETPVR